MASSVRWTVFLLCASYTMDFYNLSIYAISYNDIAVQMWGITDPDAIQRTRIVVNNWQNLGIVLGAILFGVLGDKIGRVAVLRYSIFLYASATIASVYAPFIGLFTVLRFICGLGLACEFSVSAVLIMELVPPARANWYASFLYLFGIVGGLIASILGWLFWEFWELLFYVGSAGGFIILALRAKLKESDLLLDTKRREVAGKAISWGKVTDLWARKNRMKTLRLYVLGAVFQLLISYMFFYPSFMQINMQPGASVKLLLQYFFIGGIIGTLVAGYFIKRRKNYKQYFVFSYAVCLVVTTTFPFVNDVFFIPYCLVLGMVAGGHPVAWIQLVSKSYGTNIRSTATNFLFAMGRLTNIVLNAVLVHILSWGKGFSYVLIGSGVFVIGLSLYVLGKISDRYDASVDFTD